MSRKTLEERVAALENQRRVLLASQTELGRVKDWRRTRGAFTEDNLIKEVFAEGRAIREAERKRAKLQP